MKWFKIGFIIFATLYLLATQLPYMITQDPFLQEKILYTLDVLPRYENDVYEYRLYFINLGSYGLIGGLLFSLLSKIRVKKI